jgi:hypothetical protein
MLISINKEFIAKHKKNMLTTHLVGAWAIHAVLFAIDTAVQTHNCHIGASFCKTNIAATPPIILPIVMAMVIIP